MTCLALIPPTSPVSVVTAAKEGTGLSPASPGLQSLGCSPLVSQRSPSTHPQNFITVVLLASGDWRCVCV